MIKVLKAGLFSSLQDMGRFGYRHQGVPVSGAMDSMAAQNANDLLGNSKEAVVLEFMASGPVLEFEIKTSIVITGANFTPKINDIPVSMNTVLTVSSGDTLSLSTSIAGLWGYLGVMGGFKTEIVLNSGSYYRGITKKAKVTRGDSLLMAVDKGSVRKSLPSIQGLDLYDSKLAVTTGPEFGQLSVKFQNQLLDAPFEISNKSGRMAYLLQHDYSIGMKEILTASVQPGTVQMTPNGTLIVLMRDAQTTGGYGRVLQLTQQAINHLAQKRAGEKIWFKKTELNTE